MNADNRLVAKVHIIFSLPITVLGIEIETELETKKNTIREKCVLILFILLAGEKLKINIQTQKFIILDIEEMFIKEDFSYQVYY